MGELHRLAPRQAEPLQVRRKVSRAVVEMLQEIPQADHASACLWLAREGLMGVAFECGVTEAAEVAYGFADTLASAGRRP